MEQREILHKRNVLMIRLLWFSVAIGVFSNIGSEGAMARIALIGGIGGVTSLIVSLMV